jgi:hypothetical protein
MPQALHAETEAPVRPLGESNLIQSWLNLRFEYLRLRLPRLPLQQSMSDDANRMQ